MGHNQQDCQHTMLPVPANPIATSAGNAAAAAAVTASVRPSPAICCVPAVGQPAQQASHSLTHSLNSPALLLPLVLLHVLRFRCCCCCRFFDFDDIAEI